MRGWPQTLHLNSAGLAPLVVRKDNLAGETGRSSPKELLYDVWGQPRERLCEVWGQPRERLCAVWGQPRGRPCDGWGQPRGLLAPRARTLPARDGDDQLARVVAA